jgi:hypothetical protein
MTALVALPPPRVKLPYRAKTSAISVRLGRSVLVAAEWLRSVIAVPSHGVF